MTVFVLGCVGLPRWVAFRFVSCRMLGVSLGVGGRSVGGTRYSMCWMLASRGKGVGVGRVVELG